MANIVQGDDYDIIVQLLKNGSTFVIDPGATVKFVVVNGTQVVIGPTTIQDTDPGNDWTNSIVVVPLTSADTDPLESNSTIFLEIKITDGGKNTTWKNIGSFKVVRSYIN